MINNKRRVLNEEFIRCSSRNLVDLGIDQEDVDIGTCDEIDCLTFSERAYATMLREWLEVSRKKHNNLAFQGGMNDQASQVKCGWFWRRRWMWRMPLCRLNRAIAKTGLAM